MDWLQLAGQLAQAGLPSLGTLLGTAFGGPLGAGIGGAVGRGAAAAIGAALGVPPTPEAISTAVAADPEGARIKLAQIEADAKVQADYLADVQSARQMEVVAIQADHGVAWVPVVITGLVYCLVAAIMVSVAMGWLREDGILVGWVLGVGTMSTSFWFGTTDQSRRKDNTLSQVATSAVTPSPGVVAQQALRAGQR